jgi:hypothetical protein
MTINLERLLTILGHAIRCASSAGSSYRGLLFLGPSPAFAGNEMRILECGTLITHRNWALRAGNNQTELAKVVESLQANPVVGFYRDWRKVAVQ